MIAGSGRIGIVALGSQGDVRPTVALARGLRAAGYEVAVGSHADLAVLAEDHGIEFHAVAPPVRDRLRKVRDRVHRGPGFIRDLAGVVFEPAQAVAGKVARMCANCDALIGSSAGVAFIEPVARARRRPWVTLRPLPDVPTGRHAHPMFPQWPLGPLYNRATYRAAAWLFARHRRQIPTRLRRRRPVPDAPLTLVGVSPSVVERPADWPDSVHMAGFLFLPEPDGRSVPEPLAAFVERGPRPVYVGFGTAVDFDLQPAYTEQVVLEVLERLDLRAVVLRGANGMFREVRSARVFAVDAADFAWLLPRMAAAVHHAGAGTMASCLRAGVPQVSVPYGADEPYWARRIAGTGVGASPVPRPALTAGRLEKALREVLEDDGFRRRAADMSRSLAREDGVASAVAILERHWRLRSVFAE